jgi:hypothetical protein
MQSQLPTDHIIHLNSGGPDLKVVAFDGSDGTVEWLAESSLEQMTLPAVCFRL